MMCMCVCPRHISVVGAFSGIIICMSAIVLTEGASGDYGIKQNLFFFFPPWLMLAQGEEMTRFTGFEISGNGSLSKHFPSKPT